MTYVVAEPCLDVGMPGGGDLPGGRAPGERWAPFATINAAYGQGLARVDELVEEWRAGEAAA